MEKSYKIKRLTKYSESLHKELSNLLFQLSPNRKVLNKNILRKALASPNTYLFGLFDGDKLIATGTLIVMNTFPAQRGYLHDLVVDKNYRGQKLGHMMMDKIIETANKLKLEDIDLTSKPRRNTKNFFPQFGFKKRQTNSFRLEL